MNWRYEKNVLEGNLPLLNWTELNNTILNTFYVQLSTVLNSWTQRTRESRRGASTARESCWRSGWSRPFGAPTPAAPRPIRSYSRCAPRRTRCSTRTNQTELDIISWIRHIMSLLLNMNKREGTPVECPPRALSCRSSTSERWNRPLGAHYARNLWYTQANLWRDRGTIIAEKRVKTVKLSICICNIRYT